MHTLRPASRPENLGPLAPVPVQSSIKGISAPVELAV